MNPNNLIVSRIDAEINQPDPKVVQLESEVMRRLKERRKLGIVAYSEVKLSQLYKDKLVCGGVVPTEIRRSNMLSDGLVRLISALIEFQATTTDVWPSVARLAYEIGKSVGQTRRLIREGEKKRILHVQMRKSVGDEKLNISSVYTFVYNPEIFDVPESPRKKPPSKPGKKDRTQAGTPCISHMCGTSNCDSTYQHLNGRVLLNVEGNSYISSETSLRDINVFTPPSASDLGTQQQIRANSIGGGGENKPLKNISSSSKTNTLSPAIKAIRSASKNWFDNPDELYWEDREARQRIERKFAQADIDVIIPAPILLKLKRILHRSQSNLREFACLITPKDLRNVKEPIAILFDRTKNVTVWLQNADLPDCELCEDDGRFRDPDHPREEAKAWYPCNECAAGEKQPKVLEGRVV